MRLDKKEVEIITQSFKKHFGSNDHLWLFGSRVDPHKRGGDIDLYVETEEVDAKQVVQNKLQFVNDLWLQLGEQKIDVILNMLLYSKNLSIYAVARKEGILLV
jgi:hypothetical protein